MSNQSYPIIQLKKGKEASIQRFHPWLFSGAIYTRSELAGDGELVHLQDSHGNVVATAYFNEGSIAAKILAFEKIKIDQGWIDKQMVKALSYRQGIGLGKNEQTNVFRLVHGEGDGLPGLIIDYYNGTAVIQCHSMGMYRMKEWIIDALQRLSLPISAIYLRSKSSMPKNYRDDIEDGFVMGSEEIVEVTENGLVFKVDIVRGQKTGFFIDQRDNRNLLGTYAKGRKVLNTFGYTGGFSVYAATNGADKVVSVDISESAIDQCKDHMQRNAPKGLAHDSIAEDVFDYLTASKENFDLICLDPPAFAKSKFKRNNAVQAYKRLNALAMEKIQSGGLIFTFSCSQVVDRQLFERTVYSAALEAGRPIRILHRLGHAACHPTNIYHPEGEYLKGLVLSL